MMKSSSLAIASAVAASLLVACMSPVIGEKTATIIIATAPAPGSRALTTTWPMGGLPVFSDITVSVLDSKGNEMLLPKEPVVSGNSISVTVTAGNDLTLVVDAAPDWGATATVYGEMPYGYPTLVTMYSGKKAFSVSAGETASVTIALATSGTKILLPHQATGPIWSYIVADNLADAGELLSYTLGGLSADSFFDYDKYGHLYVSSGPDVIAYRDIGSGSSGTANYGESTIRDIAISENANRLYASYSGGLYYTVLDTINNETPTVSGNVNAPAGYYFSDGYIAADNRGYLYASANLPDETPGILKMTVGEPVANTIETVAVEFASFQALGIGYWTGSTFNPIPIADMTIVDDELYIIANNINASDYMYVNVDIPSSRGKIVTVDCATMLRKWETGWSGDGNNFPVFPNSQFYGPKRFVAVAPKRLYIFDNGFSWNGSYYGNYFINVYRVAEIDRESRSIVNTGLSSPTSYFDTDYSALFQSYSGC